MRRKDKQIKEEYDILLVMEECKICRLAMIYQGKPYLVPMNFGFEYTQGQLILYFHSAFEGQKITALRENPQVCFEMEIDKGFVPSSKACASSYAYQSVIGFGKAEFIENPVEKSMALNKIMQRQCGRIFDFSEKSLASVCVFKVIASSFTGKQSDN
ncbi:MAG: pyridoxamine 5'-phosphate oxidase family protein [Firmicutes bacterium]|nr:pyridoxamine 5'-phosphate oxidase family protein [Bacillota bacterium]